jgi:hypothetical protein
MAGVPMSNIDHMLHTAIQAADVLKAQLREIAGDDEEVIHDTIEGEIDLQGLICTAYVSAANTVTIVLTNYTGGSITLGAGYFKVMVAF